MLPFDEASIPQAVQEIMQIFHAAGYPTFLAGGCLRDLLLGLAPNDYDLATQATPDKVGALFPDKHVISTGAKFGTVTLLWGDERFDITTFRSEGRYCDHRRPATLRFGQTVEDDLERRDFTINAIAWNPAKGLVDPHGGVSDLKHRILRTVGDPHVRFSEDYLRLWRALRFVLRFDLTIDQVTGAAIIRELEQADPVLPAERLAGEWREILQAPNLPARLAEESFWYPLLPRLEVPLRQDLPATEIALPNTAPPFVEEAAFWAYYLTLAARSKHPFYPIDSLKRLALPRELRTQIERYLTVPPLPANDVEALTALRKFGRPALIRRLTFEIALRQSFGSDSTPYRSALARINALLAEEPCYSLNQLAVNGNDLATMGIRGSAIGHILDALLTDVISDQVPNDPKQLRKRAGEIYETY